MVVRSVGVFGSTGSIGTQTLDLIRQNAEKYRVFCLTANENVALLVEQAKQFQPDYVSLASSNPAKKETLLSELPTGVKFIDSVELSQIAGEADICINGIVGFAGLSVTIGALQGGTRLGLANKESLVAAGPVVAEARKTLGAELIPVDSEHSAIFQCLQTATSHTPVRLQLTASGGPFRNFSAEDLENVTIEDALAHPTWSMGPKITVDSSTLANKGLEVIEALELFRYDYGVSIDDIDVVVHPQSVVHSMITFTDGSTIAQLSEPDMRLPISYALSYPDRNVGNYGVIDWSQQKSLEFHAPDPEKFKCLAMAFEVARQGGAAPAWFNAANEIAVAAFLDGRIRWIEIAAVIEESLQAFNQIELASVEAVVELDLVARAATESVVAKIPA